MSEQELKPCPFCGSDNIAIRFESVVCRECDANLPSYHQETAIEYWNTRTPSPRRVEAAEIRELISKGIFRGPYFSLTHEPDRKDVDDTAQALADHLNGEQK